MTEENDSELDDQQKLSTLNNREGKKLIKSKKQRKFSGIYNKFTKH